MHHSACCTQENNEIIDLGAERDQTEGPPEFTQQTYFSDRCGMWIYQANFSRSTSRLTKLTKGSPFLPAWSKRIMIKYFLSENY